jgi:tRNA 2-thiouridine synthesizing protein B
MLHLIQKSPFQTQYLSECLNIASKDDAFLLMQDGVYAIQKSDFIQHNKNIYALESDLNARGLSVENTKVSVISYSEFVTLTEQHNKVLSWY